MDDGRRRNGRYPDQPHFIPTMDGPVVTLPLDTSPSFEIGIAAPVWEMQSPAAAELMKFMQKDLIHAFE